MNFEEDRKCPSRKQPRYVTENQGGENLRSRENTGFRKMEVETRFPPPWPGEISFSGPRRRSLERLGPRGSLPPRRHNTSHYVIRASLDTAIYHSSARIPIYRSSPYACKTLPISPIPLRPFSSLSTSPVERKEGRQSRKTIGAAIVPTIEDRL